MRSATHWRSIPGLSLVVEDTADVTAGFDAIFAAPFLTCSGGAKLHPTAASSKPITANAAPCETRAIAPSM